MIGDSAKHACLARTADTFHAGVGCINIPSKQHVEDRLPRVDLDGATRPDQLDAEPPDYFEWLLCAKVLNVNAFGIKAGGRTFE